MKKKKPASVDWRERLADWFWNYGCYVRLCISIVALLISLAALFMA